MNFGQDLSPKGTKGASCLYINKLADVDMGVLRELVRESFEHANASAQT